MSQPTCKELTFTRMLAQPVVLDSRPGAQVRHVPMGQLTRGVLHSKFWVVDGRHIYMGSANMDWRSLTQVSTRAQRGTPTWRSSPPYTLGALPDVPCS